LSDRRDAILIRGRARERRRAGAAAPLHRRATKLEARVRARRATTSAPSMAKAIEVVSTRSRFGDDVRRHPTVCSRFATTTLAGSKLGGSTSPLGTIRRGIIARRWLSQQAASRRRPGDPRRGAAARSTARPLRRYSG
jgi:hypothetical protein